MSLFDGVFLSVNGLELIIGLVLFYTGLLLGKRIGERGERLLWEKSTSRAYDREKRRGG